MLYRWSQPLRETIKGALVQNGYKVGLLDLCKCGLEVKQTARGLLFIGRGVRLVKCQKF